MASSRRTSWPVLVLLASLWPSCPVRAEKLHFKAYTVAEGLAGGSVRCIRQDSNGFLWFCTDLGVSRFDGREFVTYGSELGPARRSVNDLLVSSMGDYCVATGDGIYRLTRLALSEPGASETGHSDSAVQMAAREFFAPGDDQGGRIVAALAEGRDGSLWCATHDGLYRLERSEAMWTSRLVYRLGSTSAPAGESETNVLLRDPRDSLWVGTSQGLFRIWPNGRTDTYTTKEGLPDPRVTALGFGGHDHVWVGTAAGLCSLVVNPSRFAVEQLFTTQHGLPSNHITCLAFDTDDTVWVGTTSGLAKIATSARTGDREIKRYTRTNGLLHEKISALCLDRAGSLWVGTDGGGAMRMDRDSAVSYQQADGLAPGQICAIADSRDGPAVLTSTERETFISSFDGTQFHATRMSASGQAGGPRPFRCGPLLRDHEGDWWMCTSDGLYRYAKGAEMVELAWARPKAVYRSRDGLAGDDVRAVFEDSRWNIWVCAQNSTEGAIDVWERERGAFGRIADMQQLPGNATAFCEDSSGGVWIGCERGVARFRNGSLQRFDGTAGAPQGQAQALWLDHTGRIWIASSGDGVARVEDPESADPRFTKFTVHQGLSSDDARCMAEDEFGRLYVGTSRGLDRFDPGTGRFVHCASEVDVLQTGVPALWADHRGALWIGTAGCVSRMSVAADRPASRPAVLITAVRYGNVPLAWSEVGVTQLPKLTMERASQDLQVEFVGITPDGAETSRLQYKLQGIDRDWSAPTGERLARYASIPPGDYRFLLQLAGSPQTNGTPTSFSFVVAGPLWRQWWLLAPALAAVAAGGYALYRRRVRKLVELERVRTRIATDLHDDIGSSLTQIAVLSEVVRQKVRRGEKPASEPLSRIAEISRELVDSMDDIVWSINPQKDHVSDLIVRMRQFASDLFSSRDVPLRFSVPELHTDAKLGATVRRQVFLVFKEGLNNVLRHSGCAEARVEMRLQDGWIVLEMFDDGKGFDPGLVELGHGLASMKARARALGGEFEVRTSPGAGTVLTLRVPLRGRTRIDRAKG